MAFDQISRRNLKKLLRFSSKARYISLLNQYTLACLHVQNHNYTNVYMKWKKDSYLDSIDSIHKSLELKPILALKNRITASPQNCIPISDVSKKGLQLDVPIKVARLTRKAAILNEEEEAVYRDYKDDLQERLKKFILMSVEDRLPLKIIQGMLWYLGLPDDYLRKLEGNFDACFEVVEMGDGLKGLAVVKTEKDKKILSVLEKNASRSIEAFMIPFFPSKGLRLKTKILDWLDHFQKLPYVSPYEKCPDLYRDSDVAEKRVVGVLHELLSLFVEHSVERKRVLCLRKYLGLPQKVHKAFERHPHVFYLSLRNKTCTAILKEAYCGCDKTGIEAHPLVQVRKKYIDLVKESKVILKNRRHGNRSFCSGDEKLELNLSEDEKVFL
ncbi:hypothetical protein L2E82_13738 [Cichorium intybus]|uniref:Uncharacterized protein n=1 Tax=Cichorium intybus TaxID=13427 RepID=A0ACB9EY07_CICIN|nr:hypothetical protein L2E82_13738 [Cichorium intybus]